VGVANCQGHPDSAIMAGLLPGTQMWIVSCRMILGWLAIHGQIGL